MDEPGYVVTEFEDWELEVEAIELDEPGDGFVPDAETAVRVAEAILGRIFGEDILAPQRPFRVMLRDGRWIIKGSIPEHALGGVAHIEISQGDGRILRVAHGE